MVSLFLDIDAEVVSCLEGEEVLITLAAPLSVGARINVDILVENENRNTLNVLVPLRAKNDRVPKLMINEIRTEGDSVTNAAKAKVEFVEFIALTSGNLGALQFYCAGNSITKPVYEFPPAEIKAGEFIVLHLRTPSPDCIDETGDNLALSGGNEALPSARDFWVPGSSKLIHKDDVLYLMDQDEKIIDAVLLSTSTGSVWSKTALNDAAQLAARQGVWFPRGGKDNVPGTYFLAPSDAIYSTGTTATRTICRETEFCGSPEYWYITATSCATPGTVNNPKR